MPSIQEKGPVVSYGRPLVYLDLHPHGYSTHDFPDLELRHHHAVDTNEFIIFLIFLFFFYFAYKYTLIYVLSTLVKIINYINT